MYMDIRATAHNLELLKYPRTPHLQGSRLQDGDTDTGQVRYAALAGQWLVVEEKLDGANAGISFTAGGELRLQSRGHYLTGGGRERQFNLFKQWASAHEHWLLERLEDRFVLYGEWLHKKHSVFYDRLPHYFCEFDVWDRATGLFLSTAARRCLLEGGAGACGAGAVRRPGAAPACRADGAGERFAGQDRALARGVRAGGTP